MSFRPGAAHGASTLEHAVLVCLVTAVEMVPVVGIGRVAAAQLGTGAACLTSPTCSGSPTPGTASRTTTRDRLR